MAQGTEVDRLFVSLGWDLKNFNRGIQKFNSKLDAMGKRMRSIGTTMTAAVTLPIAGAAAGALKAAADFEKMTKALEAVMGSGEAASRELAQLQRIAQQPGIGFQQAVRASVRLQVVGQSAAEARDLIKELGNAIAASGGTAEDLDEVVRQFSQILSLGKLTQENLGQITERAPGVAAALQRAFGTQTAEGIRDQITSMDDFVARLQTALSEAERVEGGLANAFANLRISVTQAAATIGQELNQAFNLQRLTERITTFVSDFSQAFQRFSETTQRTIFTIIGIIGAGGPLVFAFGVAASAISFLLTPLGAVAAGVAALSAVIGTVALDWTDAVKRMQQAFAIFVSDITTKVGFVANLLSNLYRPVQPQIAALFDVVKSGAGVALGTAAKEFNRLQDEIKTSETLLDTLLGQFDDLRQRAQGVPSFDPMSGGGSGQVLRPSQAIGGLSGAQGALGGTGAIESGNLQGVGKLNERLARARFQLADLQAKSTVAFQVGVQGAQVFAQGLGNVIANTLTLQGGITSIGDAVKGLGNVFRDTFNSIISQLARAVAKAAAFSALISVIPGLGSIGGATSFGGFFTSAIGLAQGGIVPAGFPDDTFPARLSSGEAVIPLDRLPNIMKRMQGTGGGTLRTEIDLDTLRFYLDQNQTLDNA